MVLIELQPDDLREGYATTGLFSGTIDEVVAHIEKKCG
jgi:hypothetical protein